MISNEEKECYESLKKQLVVTIKAIQKEGKPFPDSISKAMAVVYLLDDAIKNNDQAKYTLLLNELADENGEITFKA